MPVPDPEAPPINFSSWEGYLDEGKIAKLEGDWKKWRGAAMAIRRREELWWNLCLRFFGGDQWIRKQGTAIVPIAVSDDRPRLTINILRQAVLTRVAHILKNRPQGQCRPRTGTESARDSCRIGNLAIEYFDLKGNLREKDWETVLWTQITGNCFRKTYWDDKAGSSREVPVPQPQETDEGAPVVGLDGKPVVATRQIPEGEPVIDVVYPFEALPQPGSRSLAQCEKFAQETFKPLFWVKERFGARAEELRAAETFDNDVVTFDFGAASADEVRESVADRVKYSELWYKPCEDYPKGLVAVFCNETFMGARETPPGYLHIPFTHYVDIKTKSFWGHSCLRDAIQIQRAYNVARSRMEFKIQSQRNKLWVPFEAGVGDEEITDEDNEVVRHASGYRGAYVNAPNIGNDEIGHAEKLRDEMDGLMGGTRVMQGGVANSETRSARMLNYEQQYNGTVLGLAAMSIEMGVQSERNQVLSLLKANVKESRDIQAFVGPGKEVEIVHFMGSDLEGIADYVVEIGSAIPKTLAATQDQITEILKSGVIPPQLMPQFLKMLGMPSDLTDWMNDSQLDRDRAKEEDYLFESLTPEKVHEAVAKLSASRPDMQGAPPEALPPIVALRALGLCPKDFEDHKTHRLMHAKSRKSKAYRALPPEIQALWDEHDAIHEQMLADAMAPPVPPGMPPPGQPGMPPPPLPGSPQALAPGRPPPGLGGAGAVSPPGQAQPPHMEPLPKH